MKTSLCVLLLAGLWSGGCTTMLVRECGVVEERLSEGEAAYVTDRGRVILDVTVGYSYPEHTRKWRGWMGMGGPPGADARKYLNSRARLVAMFLVVMLRPSGP